MTVPDKIKAKITIEYTRSDKERPWYICLEIDGKVIDEVDRDSNVAMIGKLAKHGSNSYLAQAF